MRPSYSIQCFNCLSEFDAIEAIWCSCNPQHPTKVCPFCLGCFCAAGEKFKDGFWRDAPPSLREELETLSQSRMLIGEMLVRSGMLTTSQLLDALNRQKTDGRRLGEILVDTGVLTAARLEQFLKSQHTVTAIDVTRARVDAMMIRKLGVERCIEKHVLPLEAEAFRDRHIMTLAMADPSNAAEVERVMQATGYQVIPGAASAEAIVAVIRSIFPPGSEIAPPSRRPVPPAPAGRECAALLMRALQRRASHLQIQSQGGSLKVFYRIDGALYLDRAPGTPDLSAAVDGFKSMAGLEPAAQGAPRAGRAPVTLDGCEYHVIVRTRPGREGEDLMVKLLDPMSFPPRLDELTLPAEVLDRARRALDLPSGLLVVSAPPSSGAASTFYGLITEMISQGRRPALLESPRAVNLTETSTQEEFFPEVQGSFAEALARAAASGADAVAICGSEGFAWTEACAALPQRSLVVCKMESRSLPDAMLRLVAAGYPAAALGRRPTLVLHQRLVRRICQACRDEVSNAEALAASLRLEPAEARRVRLWRGTGCDECRLTPGFRGRLPLAHALRVNEAVGAAVEAAVARGAGEALMEACRAAGMTSLRNEALAALTAGLTTHEEITGRSPAA